MQNGINLETPLMRKTSLICLKYFIQQVKDICPLEASFWTQQQHVSLTKHQDITVVRSIQRAQAEWKRTTEFLLEYWEVAHLTLLCKKGGKVKGPPKFSKP